MGVLSPDITTKMLIDLVLKIQKKYLSRYPDILVEFVGISQKTCPNCQLANGEQYPCVRMQVTASERQWAETDICPICHKSPP